MRGIICVSALFYNTAAMLSKEFKNDEIFFLASRQIAKKFKKEFGSLAKDLESVYENDLLNKLIEKSSIKDEPILVINNDNKNVGVITQADLLKAVVEGSDGE